MEKLPAEQKAALIFREVEGLSYQEMAGAMGCSIGTVMSRLHYGRKRMQELLKDYMGAHGQGGDTSSAPNPQKSPKADEER
jgi:RNA polymerase sigma-70 factor (ECF subfamily)